MNSQSSLTSQELQVRAQTVSLVVITVIAVTYMVYWLRPVLVPLVVALFVVSGIRPILLAFEQSLGVSRIIAAALTFLAGIAIMVAFGCALWVSILDLASNAGDYRERVRELSDRATQWLPALEKEPDQQAVFEPDRNKSMLNESTPTTDSSGGSDVENIASSSQLSRDEKMSRMIDSLVATGISTVSQSLMSLVSTSAVVLIYVFFLLIGAPSVPEADSTVRAIDSQVRSYLALKTIISVFTGLAFGMTLRLFGVPMAFTFGVLAFLLNFIPNIGPIVASVLPIPLIVLDPSGNLFWMGAVIVATGTIQLISGNLIEPKVMGDSSDLHPVTILLALMFWGMMWGIVGMFLATPITAGVKIVLDKFESTHRIANLMAGRFANNSATPSAT